MNILMMTNTYTPFVGGVARSIDVFAQAYRRKGHEVVIVAPTYEGTPEIETNVVRMPAIQHFNGTDFSLRLPIPGFLTEKMEKFKPSLVHSHHPYLIGDTALRLASRYSIPLVFTYHTMYEQYTHYVPGDSQALKRFVISLCAGYANLSDMVFAPSYSIRDVLRKRGVDCPIEVIPTGIDINSFQKGDRKRFRDLYTIPEESFVIGFVSRLAPEKNLQFLWEVFAEILQINKNVHVIIVGDGPSRNSTQEFFNRLQWAERLHVTGSLQGQDLIDVYHSFDVFAFASKSETQGLVITEAMATGKPVVALNAPGVNDVVEDGFNGILLEQDKGQFVAALNRFVHMDDSTYSVFSRNAERTAGSFSIENTSSRALEIYARLKEEHCRARNIDNSIWTHAKGWIKGELDILLNVSKAAEAALSSKRSGD